MRGCVQKRYQNVLSLDRVSKNDAIMTEPTANQRSSLLDLRMSSVPADPAGEDTAWWRNAQGPEGAMVHTGRDPEANLRAGGRGAPERGMLLGNQPFFRAIHRGGGGQHDTHARAGEPLPAQPLGLS